VQLTKRKNQINEMKKTFLNKQSDYSCFVRFQPLKVLIMFFRACFWKIDNSTFRTFEILFVKKEQNKRLTETCRKIRWEV